jgi:hypothetical protein
MEMKISQDVLKKKLNLGNFNFIYEKLDGTMRSACGTTNSDLIPENKLPKGGKSVSGVSYFDLDLNDWRSVAKDRKVMVSVKELMSFIGSPNLEEEEITFMMWKDRILEDRWLCRFIEVIIDASVIDAVELSHGSFKKLIRVIKNYVTDSDYEEELNSKWYRLLHN